MERPGDDYKKTHKVRLAAADKLFGGQVSRLQMAELIASTVSNPQLAGNKVPRFPPSKETCTQVKFELPSSI